jgi:hypothetical protein
LQELPTWELPARFIQKPRAYGRRYAVFHRQVRVGEIELEPDWTYTTQNPRVTVRIELNWVRLLWFETIRNFLLYTAINTFEYEEGTLEFLKMDHKIDLAMMEVLWKSQKIPLAKEAADLSLRLWRQSAYGSIQSFAR